MSGFPTVARTAFFSDLYNYLFVRLSKDWEKIFSFIYKEKRFLVTFLRSWNPTGHTRRNRRCPWASEGIGVYISKRSVLLRTWLLLYSRYISSQRSNTSKVHQFSLRINSNTTRVTLLVPGVDMTFKFKLTLLVILTYTREHYFNHIKFYAKAKTVYLWIFFSEVPWRIRVITSMYRSAKLKIYWLTQ